MKNLKILIGLVVVSIILQGSALFYLDRYYFASESSYNVKKVVENTSNAKPKIEVAIPADVSKLLMSYDGKYASYIQGEDLKVVNTEDNSIKTVTMESGMKLSKYIWLYDRNRLLIAEKPASGKGNFQFYYYEVSKNEKTKVRDNLSNNEINIAISNAKAEVEDMDLSTLNNAIYVKVNNGGKKTTTHRLNIMAEKSVVSMGSGVIGKIASTKHSDRLVYENLTQNRIFATGFEDPIIISGVTKPCLLGTDQDDNVYIGQYENDKIIKVFYGKLDEGTAKWKYITFKSPVDKNEIYIENGNKIYVNDGLNGILYDVNAVTQTKYEGILQGVYNGGLATISNGKLQKIEFKK